MKFKNGLLWLFLVIVYFSAGARAGQVDPSDGLSRLTIYGSEDDGPPGVLFQLHTPNTNGILYNNVDGRTGTGTDLSSLLLYELQGAKASDIVDASLNFQISYADRNGSTEVSAFSDVSIKLIGTNGSTLDPDGSDFLLPPSATKSFSVPVGDYSINPYLHSVDVTDALKSLLDQGFSNVSILLETLTDTNYGPSEVDFAVPVALNLELTDIDPGTQPLPEPASIVQVGVSIVGRTFYMLRRRGQIR